jgi:hypothetical protein
MPNLRSQRDPMSRTSVGHQALALSFAYTGTSFPSAMPRSANSVGPRNVPRPAISFAVDASSCTQCSTESTPDPARRNHLDRPRTRLDLLPHGLSGVIGAVDLSGDPDVVAVSAGDRERSPSRDHARTGDDALLDRARELTRPGTAEVADGRDPRGEMAPEVHRALDRGHRLVQAPRLGGQVGAPSKFRCTWQSMSPGAMVRPLASTTRAADAARGARACGPTHATRPSSTSTPARRRTRSPSKTVASAR